MGALLPSPAETGLWGQWVGGESQESLALTTPRQKDSEQGGAKYPQELRSGEWKAEREGTRMKSFFGLCANRRKESGNVRQCTEVWRAGLSGTKESRDMGVAPLLRTSQLRCCKFLPAPHHLGERRHSNSSQVGR